MDKVPADADERVKFYTEVDKHPDQFSNEIYEKFNCDGSPYLASALSNANMIFLKTAEYYQDTVKLSLNGFEFDAPYKYEECCFERYGEDWRKHIQGQALHETIDVNPAMPAKEYMKIMPDFSKIQCSIE